jgi:hypothetical protein
MKNKITAFFTNELSPDERTQVEARVEIDPMFAAEFEFQASIFDALEQQCLRSKIQQMMVRERLKKARQQKGLKLGVVVGMVSLVGFTGFYVSQSFKNQIVTPIEENNSVNRILPKEMPVVPEQPPTIPPLQPQIQVHPKKPSKVAAPQQGLQPAPKILRPNDTTFATTQPILPPDVINLVAGTGAGADTHAISVSRLLSDIHLTIECATLENRLAKKYKQPLTVHAKQLVQEYCVGKSPNLVKTEGRFNENLSWLMRAVYNINKNLNGSAGYCLAKIESDSDFLLEKQFCEALIHPNIPIKADFLKIFERDTFSIFHETAKDLLKK